MAGPVIHEVATDQTVPKRADVVIIGGGIIGVTSALFLAERRISVVVVEKGAIAGEQSSRNWGWCRQARRDPREFELIRESLVLWRSMNERVAADTGFRTTGILFAAHDEATEQKYSHWVRDAADAGIEAAMAMGANLSRLLPGDTSPPKAGLYCAGDGRAEPQWAAPVIAQAARRAGAQIITHCAARGIETAAGKVISVVTERGVIQSGSVVVAGGAWSRRVLKDIGITFPQLKVRASVGRTSEVKGGPECAYWDGKFAFRKRADGGYTIANGGVNVFPITSDSFRFFSQFVPMLLMDWRAVKLTLNNRFLIEGREAIQVPVDQPSPYEETRVLDPEPDMQPLERAMKALRQRYPVFENVPFAQTWAGFIDATPDAVPVISPVDGLSGLLLASGFSGHGFGISPGAAHLVADLVSGVTPFVSPEPFRFSRFSDGSNPRPLVGV